MDETLAALRKMHNLERFATELYGAQIWAFSGMDIADKLKAAMDNEQEHADGLVSRIREVGGTPALFGFLFQVAGKVLGFITTILGKAAVLKADIWVEKQAVKDYGAFLQRYNFDEKSRALTEKNLEDEKMHIRTWEEALEIIGRQG